MRILACILILLAAPAARAAGGDDSGTVAAEFLFQSGDTAYFHCNEVIGPYDSLAAPGYGEVLDAVPPLWLIQTLPGYSAPKLGASISFQHIVRPRAAAVVAVTCPRDPWDPLRSAGVTSATLDPLIQRKLFDLQDGQVVPDLVKDWEWRGRDLIVVVDTMVRLGNGAPLTAPLVKAALERYLWYRRESSEFGWDRVIAGVEAYRKGRVGHVVGLIPRSADTLQFNLTRACYTLPERLAASATAIVEWTVVQNLSPVTATAGIYDRRRGDTLIGGSVHGGRLILSVDSAQAQVTIGRVSDTEAATRVPLPELVVVCPGGTASPELLSFLHFAIDRKAAATVSCGSCAQSPDGLMPSPTLMATSERSVDMEQAQQARRLVAGRPSVRVAAVPGREAVADYLVTALKAWEFNAMRVPAGAAYDLRVEDWKFDSFDSDALVEGVLTYLRRPESDSLVEKLWSARGMQAEAARDEAYESLFARLDDQSPYVVIYQPVGKWLIDSTKYEVEVNRTGAPDGPIFTRGGAR